MAELENLDVRMIAEADQARAALAAAGRAAGGDAPSVPAAPSVADQALGVAVLLLLVATVLATAGVWIVAGLGAALICAAGFVLLGAAWCAHVVVTHREGGA